jgi:hypothetical protein
MRKSMALILNRDDVFGRVRPAPEPQWEREAVPSAVFSATVTRIVEEGLKNNSFS